MCGAQEVHLQALGLHTADSRVKLCQYHDFILVFECKVTSNFSLRWAGQQFGDIDLYFDNERIHRSNFTFILVNQTKQDNEMYSYTSQLHVPTRHIIDSGNKLTSITCQAEVDFNDTWTIRVSGKHTCKHRYEIICVGIKNVYECSCLINCATQIEIELCCAYR